MGIRILTIENVNADIKPSAAWQSFALASTRPHSGMIASR
jgi:hypothetical protein